MEARIFMKYETFVQMIDLTTNQIFIKIREKMRVHEAKTRALGMPYKNSQTSQQTQENAFFGHFWIDTKKSYFIHFC